MVVMNKTLWKDIKRLIRSTKGRFLSLTTIVLIGVSFFVGISSVSTIMGYSVDTYDDEVKLEDDFKYILARYYRWKYGSKWIKLKHCCKELL